MWSKFKRLMMKTGMSKMDSILVKIMYKMMYHQKISVQEAAKMVGFTFSKSPLDLLRLFRSYEAMKKV